MCTKTTRHTYADRKRLLETQSYIVRLLTNRSATSHASTGANRQIAVIFHVLATWYLVLIRVRLAFDRAFPSQHYCRSPAHQTRFSSLCIGVVRSYLREHSIGPTSEHSRCYYALSYPSVLNMGLLIKAWELRSRSPILPLSFLALPPFCCSNIDALVKTRCD